MSAAILQPTDPLAIPSAKFDPSHPRATGLELSEDLASECEGGGGYDSDDYDEMGDLSDSPSSRTSLSRPNTPPQGQVLAKARTRRNTAHSSSSPPNADHFTLAVKAERILGLEPGTLAHARACLENARDEVRRTSQEPSPPPLDFSSAFNQSRGGPPPSSYGHSHSDGEKDKESVRGGMKGRFDRAKKVMSITLPSGTGMGMGFGGGHGRVPSVVVGTGGKEEEERRERRRKAVDGVIHWQREVERLEREQMKMQSTGKHAGKRR